MASIWGLVILSLTLVLQTNAAATPLRRSVSVVLNGETYINKVRYVRLVFLVSVVFMGRLLGPRRLWLHPLRLQRFHWGYLGWNWERYRYETRYLEGKEGYFQGNFDHPARSWIQRVRTSSC